MAVTWWGDIELTVVPVPVVVCTCMPIMRVVRGWLHPVSVVEVSVVRVVVGEVYLWVMGAAGGPRWSAAHVEVVRFGRSRLEVSVEMVVLVSSLLCFFVIVFLRYCVSSLLCF
jgi:hypothetical protein